MSNNPYVSKTWPGKLERKIDIYYGIQYQFSTNAYISLKQARMGIAFEKNLFMNGTNVPVKGLIATYSESK